MKMTQKVLVFARQTVNFLQRDRIIGCKFCQVPLAVEFRTGVLLLNGQKIMSASHFDKNLGGTAS